MNKIIFQILCLTIVISCASSPKERTQLDEIENAYFSMLNNKDVIFWYSGTKVTSIDFSNNYRLNSVIAEIISRPQGTNYDKYIRLLFNFKNGSEEIIKDYYIGHYSYNGNLVTECIRFADWFIIDPPRLFNNNMLRYYGDLRDTNRTQRDLMVVNTETFRNVYNNESVGNTQNRNQVIGTNKLLALLLNPLASSQLGQFTRGETVNIPRAFLRVIDLQRSGDTYNFLVMVNDNNISKPFYINTNRMLNLMDISYPNTIFEELVIQYVGTENYLFNGVPRETFVFQLSR